MHPKIEVKNLAVRYADGNRQFTALEDVSFSVAAGEFVSVIGSSGCGKSTLLGVLGGLGAPSGGGAFIDGLPVRGPGLDRAFVFQHYSLFPWMTARDNVAFGIKQAKRGLPAKARREAAEAFLGKVGLEGSGKKYPAQLSGGMRQRVAIARALAMDADILLMDEPFGAVDAKNRTILQELLLSLWEGAGGGEFVYPITEDGPSGAAATRGRKTVVFVTHDIDEAMLLSDRIVMLSNSPGRVFRQVPVLFPRPRNRAVLVQSEGYARLRGELLALFFNDFGDGI
ncbi:MAG: ABC transporter ATP-binding protein [Spirochaetaceae bacterium]|jgi:NitT/TauT family transport system ATP-binding protein|nr:ABC transporter ATP-binding protein [Spirochaetaceae bacterium]